MCGILAWTRRLGRSANRLGHLKVAAMRIVSLRDFYSLMDWTGEGLNISVRACRTSETRNGFCRRGGAGGILLLSSDIKSPDMNMISGCLALDGALRRL